MQAFDLSAAEDTVPISLKDISAVSKIFSILETTQVCISDDVDSFRQGKNRYRTTDTYSQLTVNRRIVVIIIPNNILDQYTPRQYRIFIVMGT